MTDEQMREYIDHAIEKVLAPMLKENAEELMRETRLNGDFLREQWKHCPTREERLAEAEQRAWDMYAADVRGTVSDAAAWADLLLAERRKRFGSGEEAHPEPGNVAVPRELLLKCISGLRGGVPEMTRHLMADDLRALVSE